VALQPIHSTGLDEHRIGRLTYADPDRVAKANQAAGDIGGFARRVDAQVGTGMGPGAQSPQPCHPAAGIIADERPILGGTNAPGEDIVLSVQAHHPGGLQ